MSDQVTIVYDVKDSATFDASGNPLRYAHHGLKAHTVAVYDAVERCQTLRTELERLRDVVGPQDVKAIDEILRFQPE